MKVKLLQFMLLFGIATSTFAQNNQRYSGVVKDKTTGIAMEGVSLKVEGQNATTDDKGKFEIDAPEGKQLIVSYLGYQGLKITLGRTHLLDIVMDPTSEVLSEVVVTSALGLKKVAKEQGVAVTTVKGDELNQAEVVNPLTGLQSKVTGLQINFFDSGVNPQVRIAIRGTRSSNDSKNEPLVVVDGVPLPAITYFNPQHASGTRSASAFSLINPNDIESVTVLKSANAAALYGSQGVNGVLLVTTKHGSTKGNIIKFSHTSTFEQVVKLPKMQQTFGGGFNGVYQPYESRSWGPAYNGSMVNVGPILPNGSQWSVKYAPVKNQKRDFFDTGISNQENLSFSGGDDVSTYFLSGQFVNTEGIIPKDKNTRAGVLFNGSRRFNMLKTSYSVNYVHTDTDLTLAEPWINVRDMPLYIPLNELKDWKNTPQAMPQYYYSNSSLNPYWAIDNMRQDTKQDYFSGNIGLQYKFTNWFEAVYRLGYTNTNTRMHGFSNKFDDPSVPYEYYDATGTKKTVTRNSKVYNYQAAGGVTDMALQDQFLNSDFILQFNKRFGDVNFNLLLGNNYQDISSGSTSVGSTSLNVSGLYNEDNRFGNLTGGAQYYHRRSIAFYGELTVGYKDFLYATLNGRQEAVSVLNPKNRSYFYPAANVSFVFSQAFEALRNSKVLSFGKLFASIGKTGNVTVDPYQLQNTYSNVDGFPFGSLSGTTINSTKANYDLKPEFVYSYEVGAQLGFLKDRLQLDMSWSRTDSHDQIINIGTSSASGFPSGFYNAARMRGTSIELALDVAIIKTDQFQWDVNVGYTHNDNKTVSVFNDINSLHIFKGLYLSTGEPYPAIYYPDYKKDPQGRVVVDGTTGTPIQANGNSYFGTSQPVHMLGFGTTLSYKRFSLRLQADARWGQKFYTAGAEFETTAGLAPATAAYDHKPFIYPNSVIETSPGVYQPNTSVYAKGDYNFWDLYNGVNSNNLVDGSYIKLREVSLAYSVPVSIFGKQRLIKGMNVSLIGRNLLGWRAKDNIFGDPESIYETSVGFSGFRTMPASSFFGFNINFTF